MALVPMLKAREVSRGIADILRPARRMKPADAAAAYVRDHEGPWLPDLVPMMLEPLNQLAGRRYQGVVFVGPARSGKTNALLLGGLGYIVTCAPGDVLVVHMSQDTARDWSKKELDRLLRHSPEVGSRLSPRPRDDNTYDKFFRSGMVLKIGWPSSRQLSGKTLQYVLFTDYDRVENREDVDGEGSLWSLGFKRITTLMSRGKCLAESSPGGTYDKPDWKAATPHEAPPAIGITSLYNMGTRARWYWPCLHCGEYFQDRPGPAAFALPAFEELEVLVQKSSLSTLAERFAKVVCPHCGGLHEQTERGALNSRATWVHEGESIDARGVITGERHTTQIASFYQGGASAVYQPWASTVLQYLQGVLAYVRAGDESVLKTVTNTNLAAPYLPRSTAKRRRGEELMERVEDWQRGVVPAGVRFLTAAVDVQAAKFMVHVHGWGIELESWLIDRFGITASRRAEGDRTAAIDPAGYIEDWNELLEQVVKRTYPVEGTQSRLQVILTVCDSGGKAGVTERAYEFWRQMRDKGFGRRFVLIKGASGQNAARVQQTWPDNRGRADRDAGARGDVPVWLLNTNVLKDGVAADLKREKPGPGFHHLPTWVGSEYFDEITAEQRDAKGWKNPRGLRNEAFDLHAYNRAAAILLQAEQIDWNNPPPWAAPHEARLPPAPATQQKPSGRRVRHPGIT